MIPALIRKCEDSAARGEEKIVCWGTGAGVAGVFVCLTTRRRGSCGAVERIDTARADQSGGGTGDHGARVGDAGRAAVADFRGRVEWDATKPGRSAAEVSGCRVARGKIVGVAGGGGVWRRG